MACDARLLPVVPMLISGCSGAEFNDPKPRMNPGIALLLRSRPKRMLFFVDSKIRKDHENSSGNHGLGVVQAPNERRRLHSDSST
jgi:hypothetical protein